MKLGKFKKISISLAAVVFLVSAFCFLFSADSVSAADGGTNISVSCEMYGYPWCGQEAAQNPGGLIRTFYLIALGFVGAAAFGVLIYGAILWSVSGAVSTKKDAMDWISAAIWGLVLLLSAYLILYTINPELVSLKSGEELFKPISEAVQQGVEESGNTTIQFLNCDIKAWESQYGFICLPPYWDSLSNGDKGKYQKENSRIVKCPEGQHLIKYYDFTPLPVLKKLYCDS